jgi:hypothetical protein
MARATFNLVKDVWTEVATGECVVTILSAPSGNIAFNESASDTNQLKVATSYGKQFMQNQALPTFVKASEDGWIILVDGAL